MDSVFDDRRYLIPFRAALLPQIFTDVLVIGGGVAGMCAALAASAHGEVILVAKGGLADSNTYWAQGGIAAVVDEFTRVCLAPEVKLLSLDARIWKIQLAMFKPDLLFVESGCFVESGRRVDVGPLVLHCQPIV